MEPLSVTGSIIAVLQLSAKVLAYLNDVKDASKDCTQCAIEISNLYNVLLNLRFRLEEGSADTPWYTAVQALAVKNGPLDQFKQALETLQTRMTDGGRLRRAGEALVWKFKKEETASILERIERLKSLVEFALQMDHFELPQAIQSGVDKTRQDQDTARHRRLLEWISPTDYPAQQSDIIKTREEGTGQWFLDAPQVARWLSKAKGTLFCPGIPGAGKTMIAAIAINHLLKSVQNRSYGIAYIYCNYRAQEEQDTSSMLAAILKQLVQARPLIVEPIERLYKQHADRGTRPSLNEVYSALRDVLIRYPTIYIVIDALDECQYPTRRQFLAKLRDLQAGRDIRLMVTSRPIPGIVDTFRGALKLEVRASREDVMRFVAGQTYRLPRCIQRDPTLKEMVQEKIVEVVNGMFLLARLHTDLLLDKTTAKDVKSTLARLPKGPAALAEAYTAALERIKGQLGGHYELAKKVLLWITFTKRPLTTAEICCALAVELGDTELDPENKPDIEELVSVCAGLVVIDPESAIIRLVHYTLQEFFEFRTAIWDPGAQLHIATTCLTYLSFSAFRSGSCSTDDKFEERLRQNEFLNYAARHWGEHAVTAEAEVCDLACSFLLHNGLLSCAAQALEVPSYRYKGYSQSYPVGTGLHCTARFGLPGITQELLPRLEEAIVVAVNATDSQGRAPLLLAAENGHGEMAKLLINKGAEVNAQGGFYGDALQAASYRGHEQEVRLLLDKGADVNAQGGHYGSALYAASEEGHKQIVKLLLDKGADVNVQGGFYGSALQGASSGGHEQIVKLLLDKGAEVNAQGGYYGNALQAASYGGHEQEVKLLLDKDTNVNAQGGYYGNALQAASAGSHEQLVKLLLEAGANVNAPGGYYGTPLQAASAGGHEQVLRLLLDKGAEVDAQFNGSSAFSMVTISRDRSLMEILLAAGASIKAALRNLEPLDAKSPSPQLGRFLKQTALCYAAATANEMMVRDLLDIGVDVDGSSEPDLTPPLHLAAESGRINIVRMLLAAKADPTKEDHLGRTVYDYAERAGPRTKAEEVKHEIERFNKVMRLALYHTIGGGRTEVKWVEISTRTTDHIMFSHILNVYKSTRRRRWWQYSLKGFQGVCFVEGTSTSLNGCTVITTEDCIPQSKLLRDGKPELHHKIWKPPKQSSSERIWTKTFWDELSNRPHYESSWFGLRFVEGWVIRRIKLLAVVYLLLVGLIGLLWASVLKKTEAGFAITGCLIAAESLIVALLVFECQIEPAIS